MDAADPEPDRYYDIDDGRPVNDSLLSGRAPEDDAEPRKAFADISGNFTAFYAAALAAAQEMKSPPRASGLGLGYRYSPAKPPGSAAKRLWSGNELPPLPRPAGTNAQRVATALAAARGPQDGSASNDGSPTRHAPLARTAPGDGRPPLPSLGPLAAAGPPLAPHWTAGAAGGTGCGGASRASSLASNEVPLAAPPGSARGLSQRTASAGSGALLCCSGGLSFSAASEQQEEGGSAGAAGPSGSGASGSGPSGSGPSGSGPSGSGPSGSSFGTTSSSTSGGGTSCAGGGARPVPLPVPMAVPMPAQVVGTAAAAAAAGSRGASLTDADMDVDEGPGAEDGSAAGSKAAGSPAGSPGEVAGGLDEEEQEADENAGVAGVPAVRMGSTVRALSFNEAEAGSQAAGLPGAVAAAAAVSAAVGPPPSPFPYLENQLPLQAGHQPRGRQ